MLNKMDNETNFMTDEREEYLSKAYNFYAFWLDIEHTNLKNICPNMTFMSSGRL